MSREEAGSVSVEQLYRELTETTEGDIGSSESQTSEEVVGEVLAELFSDREFEFDERLTKNSLDELLVLLVALRGEKTHGKGLMEDLDELFDAQLSPGTVYPRLHELEDEEILEMHELVRTKEYRIGDEFAASSRLEEAMYQHLALGLIFHNALEEL
ncbi:MAG: helix-turn-helix transcriptional regulator [Natronomonas sp.]